MDVEVLSRVEHYCDAVPRQDGRAEDVGAFTLFVERTAGPMYARPRRGATGPVSLGDLYAALSRQRELGVPESLEWIDEVVPGLDEVAQVAGLEVTRCPLLVLDGPPQGAPTSVRMLGPDDLADLVLARAAVNVAFEVGGVAAGDLGVAARDAAVVAAGTDASGALRSGALRMAVAEVAGTPGPIGGGAHTPVARTSEITGVGVLPAYRQRGLAAALSYVLAVDALDHDVQTVFCSAENDAVARIYQRTGFRRVGTACVAEPV